MYKAKDKDKHFCNPCLGIREGNQGSIEKDKSGKTGFRCQKCTKIKRIDSRVFVKKEVWWCKNCCRINKNEKDESSSEIDDIGLGGI